MTCRKIRPSALAALAAGLMLGACSTVDRLSQVGEVPELSPVGDPRGQVAQMPVPMPMPAIEKPVTGPNSLWQAGARDFFKDQRAATVGDILTVEIEISDRAEVANTTTRSRQNAENADIPALFGLESGLRDILPEAVDPANLVEMKTDSSTQGTGRVNRAERINLTIAAVVTGVLPNGNLMIQGRQEVRVNYEVRELLVAGVVRPEDITAGNTVKHTQIAEARISYGGRGQLSDVQQPRLGQQVFDIISPF